MSTSPWMHFHSPCSLLAGWHFIACYFLFFSWLSLVCSTLTSMASISPKCWLMPVLLVWPYGPSVQLAGPALCKDAASLMISAKTVGISSIAMQFISNLLNPAFTRLHCSVTNSSNKLNCSTGWKRKEFTFKPHHALGYKTKCMTTFWLSYPLYPVER